ncbi:hypothetical protein V8C42DRAFT_309293 [Trichoderma barbatum]
MLPLSFFALVLGACSGSQLTCNFVKIAKGCPTAFPANAEASECHSIRFGRNGLPQWDGGRKEETTETTKGAVAKSFGNEGTQPTDSNVVRAKSSERKDRRDFFARSTGRRRGDKLVPTYTRRLRRSIEILLRVIREFQCQCRIPRWVSQIRLLSILFLLSVLLLFRNQALSKQHA